ncbi:MAG: TIGR04372 family glycosyltransferase [Desulfatirhabdiaceae bacterium]
MSIDDNSSMNFGLFNITRYKKIFIKYMFGCTGTEFILSYLNLFKQIVYTPLAVTFWCSRIRIPKFFVLRIGHLMVEPDSYLKEHLMGNKSMLCTVMLAPHGLSANSAAIRYWSRYFAVIENPFLAKVLKPLSVHPFTGYSTYRYATAMYQSADTFQIQKKWSNRPPLLIQETIDSERGKLILKQMGIQENAWYVCIHNREKGYSPIDDHSHSYRNVSIDNFQLAVEYIVSQGGVCIRMGDPTMQPAPFIPGLIDYAKSPYRSDWMDLYLASTCTFFLGSNSGAFEMATTFGRPVAAVNMAPLTTSPRGQNDLSIPMLYREIATSKILTFKEILDSPLASLRLTEEYITAGIKLIHNTPEEIRDLAMEQLHRVQGTLFSDSAGEALQIKFESMLKPGHYCYGRASRMGSFFLKKHEYLLN